MQFLVLGPVEATTAGGDSLPVGGPKQRLVLALLVTAAGRVVPADRLVTALWAGDAPADPRRSLQVYISNLRRTLDNVVIQHRDDGYVLHVDPGQVDALRFARLIDEGEEQLADDPGRAATTLREALGLWRGRPFGALADEPMLVAEVERLEELHRRANELRIDAELALGLHAQLVGELRELTASLPLREGRWAQLITALHRSGRQAEALDAYERARQTLAEELGIDPSPRLQALHTKVLRQVPDHDDLVDAEAPSRVLTPPSATPGPTPRSARSYELIEEVGSGGFGVVYRGRQPGVDRDVAIKVIRPEHANDPRFVRRFEIEAQTIARLEHLHIVPLYDYWREPDAAYLVMRWLRGGSLAQALRRGPWNLRPAAELIAQVAAALDVAHRYGIAHLDVKPANVLLDEEDHAYLSDFGIARGIEDPPVSPGSAPYLTPEHISGGPLTAATDIFGLGLLAFELLTGRHPYEGETPDSLAQRVLQQPLPTLRELRSDLPAYVEDALSRATAVDPDDRFASAGDLASALRASSREEPIQAPAVIAARNPYKGLQAFQESDADDFFGREHLVRQLIDRLGHEGTSGRFVAVVGPSGSGKSSLVRAGLVPAVRRGEVAHSDRWFVTTMVPGATPVAELERALIDVAIADRDQIRAALLGGDGGFARAVELALPDDGSQLLLIIDQFEELFSVASDAEREEFVRLLQHAVTDARSPLKVVVTLRADFFDHPLLDARLGELVASHTVAVAALAAEELERAVVQPARAVGVHVDRDLTAQIVGDVVQAPGALPLLQYALTELFARRAGDRLTLDGYRAIGGVHGALAGRAEALYASLDAAGKQVCHQLFLRLVTIGEVGAETRRRVTREELAGLASPDVLDEVLETYGRHRLLTFDREPATRAPTVEVAHEALLEAWDRLRRWIDDARDDLRMHRRLEAAVDEWRDSGGSDGYLLEGPRLSVFEEWADRSLLSLTTDERALLDASRDAADIRADRERSRRRREEQLAERSTTRLRALVVVSLLAAVVATTLAAVAFGQRERALQEERIATARGVASAAIAELEVDPERSILLAIEAVNTTREADGTVLAEAETALRRAIMASHVEQRLPGGGQLSIAPDGRIATVAADGTLAIRDLELLEPHVELEGFAFDPEAGIEERWIALNDDIDFSPDGSSIVAAGADLQGTILDASTGENQVRLDGDVYRPAFSADGDLVIGLIPNPTATGWEAARSVGVWDASTGTLLQRIDGHLDAVRTHELSPDGSWLATVTETEGTRVWDLESGDLLWHVPVTDETVPVYSVAIHPEGDRILLGGQDGSILVRDTTDGDLLDVFTGHKSLVSDLEVSADGGRVVSASNVSARVWDSDTGEELVALRGHEGNLAGAVFHPEGARVVTTSDQDDTTRVWNVDELGGFEHAAFPGTYKGVRAGVSFSPDGRHIAVAGPGNAVHIRDVATGADVRTLETQHPVRLVAYSPDGSTIAASSVTGSEGTTPDQRQEQVHAWDATNGEPLGTTAITGFAYPLWDLAMSEDGDAAAIATNPGLLQIVEVDNGTEVLVYEHDRGPVYHVSYTPEARQLVVGAQEAGLVIDAATGEVVHDLDVERSVIDVAFLDDERMVTNEVHGLVRVWDRRTGEVGETLAETAGTSVAATGGSLAFTDGDAVVVRDLDSGGLRFEVRYEADPARVRFSPDGRHLVTVLRDAPVHLHVVDIDDLLDLAGDRVTRALTEEECVEFLATHC